jgi:hypothetical protein
MQAAAAAVASLWPPGWSTVSAAAAAWLQLERGAMRCAGRGDTPPLPRVCFVLAEISLCKARPSHETKELS